MSHDFANHLTIAGNIVRCAIYFEGEAWKRADDERGEVIKACIADAMRRRKVTMEAAAWATGDTLGMISYRREFYREASAQSSFMQAMAASFAEFEKYL